MKIYNSLSKVKEELKPLEKPYVKIMVCGPTLYGDMHLGHARLFVTLDLFARYLKYHGYKPLLLIVLTDIDPKIFRKAKSLGVDYNYLTNKYILEFKKDLSLLNVDLNNMIFAKASDYVYHAHDNILYLMNNKHAYINKGNIYFDTSSINDYGMLSALSKHELESRPIDLIEGKRNIYDFLIWNGREIDYTDYYIKSKDLGKGLPWWHMQDVSIALANFNSYDLHAGAIELIYPHHEAQRAMLKILSNEPRYWFHVGLLTINNRKMGKSNHNVIRVRDAINKYGTNVIRIYLLSTHYRNNLEFDEQKLEMLHTKIKNIKFGNDDLDTLEDDLNIDDLSTVKRSLLESVVGLRV